MAFKGMACPFISKAPEGSTVVNRSGRTWQGNCNLVWVINVFLFALLCTYLSYTQLPSHVSLETKPQSPSEIVDEVLKAVPLIDGHNDFPWIIRALYQNRLYDGNITRDSSLPFQVDFPRLREGRAGGMLWSIFIPCPEDINITSTPQIATSKFPDSHWPDDDYYKAIHHTFQQIDLVQRMISKFREDLVTARDSDDVWRNHAQSRRISSLMGVEGLHSIGNSPGIMRVFHQLGVRYVTLTHFCNNQYADSANQDPYWHGVSEAGKAIITEMNRIGLMVDLSHTSADTQRQVLDFTDVPLIFSHASSYTVCPNPRNVPDDVLWKLKKNNGVIMITFLKSYVNCKAPENATILDVVDHFEYVGNLIGYEHVGLGSDFDGISSGPKGIEDVSKYPAVLEELAFRGVSLEKLKGVAGANLLRVLKDVEQATRRFTDINPLEDRVKVIEVPESQLGD